MTRVLAIDIGGTNMRSALYTGDVAALTMLELEAAPADLPAFQGRLTQLVERAGGVDAIGLAVPGLVEGTACRWIPNLPYLDGIDLKTLFPSIGITIGNDAQIALLAESLKGAAKGCSDVILIAIGTGIGSAVLANGQIIAGSRGAACSLGWACADMDDIGAERDGWLERFASGRALDRLAAGLGMKHGAELIDAARNGSAAARDALNLPAARLGTVLAGAVALLDPYAILISGGLSEALDVIRAPLVAAMRRHLPAHMHNTELRAGVLGPRAGLVGAALAGTLGNDWRRLR